MIFCEMSLLHTVLGRPPPRPPCLPASWRQGGEPGEGGFIEDTALQRTPPQPPQEERHVICNQEVLRAIVPRALHIQHVVHHLTIVHEQLCMMLKDLQVNPQSRRKINCEIFCIQNRAIFSPVRTFSMLPINCLKGWFSNRTSMSQFKCLGIVVNVHMV